MIIAKTNSSLIQNVTLTTVYCKLYIKIDHSIMKRYPNRPVTMSRPLIITRIIFLNVHRFPNVSYFRPFLFVFLEPVTHDYNLKYFDIIWFIMIIRLFVYQIEILISLISREISWWEIFSMSDDISWYVITS